MSAKNGNCPKQENDVFKASNTGEARKGIRFHSSYFITPLQELNLLKIQKHSKNSKTLLSTSFFGTVGKSSGRTTSLVSCYQPRTWEIALDNVGTQYTC